MDLGRASIVSSRRNAFCTVSDVPIPMYTVYTYVYIFIPLAASAAMRREQKPMF